MNVGSDRTPGVILGPEGWWPVPAKKVTVTLADYQVAALRGMSRERNVPKTQLFREALDLLIAHYHFSRIEPEYTRDVDEFIAKNRELLKKVFR
jgi:hypothetical protein